MNRGIKYFTLLTSSLLLISCFEVDTASLEKEISKVHDNQKIILQKIEAISKLILMAEAKEPILNIPV